MRVNEERKEGDEKDGKELCHGKNTEPPGLPEPVTLKLLKGRLGRPPTKYGHKVTVSFDR